MGNLQGKVYCKMKPERVRSLFCGESYVTVNKVNSNIALLKQAAEHTTNARRNNILLK